MKRIGILMMAALLLAGAVGCAGNAAAGGNPFDGKTLADILDELYAGADVEIPSLETVAITAENEAAFLGTSGLKFSEAIASEPAISAIAYSVCLVRMQPGEDVEAARQAIEENANPAKWICAQVTDPKNVIVDSAGDVIILIMTDEYAQALHESFKALKNA